MSWISENKEFVSICGLAGVFLGNIWRQNYLRKKEIREKLGNEIIHTCDKMLRTAVEIETCCLDFRESEEMKVILGKDHDHYEVYIDLWDYYHKRSEIESNHYDIYMSDLRKCIKDFNKYWPDKKNKDEVLAVMNRIFFIEFANPSNILIEDYKTEEQVTDAADKIRSQIWNNVLFDGVGFHLIYIQRLIDQESPIIYVKKKESKDKLLDKLKNYNSYASEIDKGYEK